MHFLVASLALLSLTTQPQLVSATVYGDSLAGSPDRFHHTGYITLKLRLRANVVSNHAGYVDKRSNDAASAMAAAAVSTSSISPPVPTASALPAPTDNTTQTACLKAFTSLDGCASNPAGMALCYAIPFFDTIKGDFRASLFLYQISPATGDWVTLEQQSLTIGLSYPGATIASGVSNRKVKRATHQPTRWIVKRGTLVKRFDPQLISDLSFVGQVDSSLTSQLTNQTAMQAALSPYVLLSGTLTNGTSVSTILANNEASFVTGAFSDPEPVVPVAPPMAQAATLPTLLEPTPFVLPGTALGVFPTGLIITGVWTVMFVTVVGLGTWGRVQFRDSYRRKMDGIRATGISGLGAGGWDVPGYDRLRVGGWGG